MSTPTRAQPAVTFRAVGAFVPKATQKVREKQGLHAAEIILNWPAIVGPGLAGYTAPRRIRWPKAPDRTGPAPKSFDPRSQKTTLEIWVAGGRAHEIPYLKPQIISRINAYFGYRAVTDILPVDGPVLQAPRARLRARITEADITAAARVHGLTLGDPVADALAKLAANIRKGKR